VFFSFYLVFIKLKKEKKLSDSNLKILIASSFLVLLLAYPAMLSFDIFNYILTAKVAFLYHENPYLIMPIQITPEPMLAFTHAANKIALYGPSWIGLSFLPHILGFGNFLLTLLNFKLLSIVFYLMALKVFIKLKKDTALVFFALNPLVLMETVLSGHNDIVMMFFSLIGILFLSRRKVFLAFVMLSISILVKYSTLLLLPVFIYISYANYKRKEINWEKMYISCALLMFVAFLLSPIREEIYPWYFIWPLLFVSLTRSMLMKYISVAFSFGLLFRYVPFMLLGTYADPTPIIKTLVTFIPPILTLLFVAIKYKLWQKKFYIS
jgi:hypothetical protein